MSVLLDTQSFLWFVAGSSKLARGARAAIEAEASELLLSVGSLWEIAIKIGLGKLTLGQPFEDLVPRQLELNGIRVLSIDIRHLTALIQLPFHHRDPFDRLLAAQCAAEGLPIVSSDPVFDAYGITRLW